MSHGELILKQTLVIFNCLLRLSSDNNLNPCNGSINMTSSLKQTGLVTKVQNELVATKKPTVTFSDSNYNTSFYISIVLRLNSVIYFNVRPLTLSFSKFHIQCPKEGPAASKRFSKASVEGSDRVSLSQSWGHRV